MSVITLDNKPQWVDFSRNPICFELTAGNLFLTPGIKAEDYLILAGTTQHGDQIIMSFLEYEFTFTFTYSPDDSGFQLMAGQSVHDTVEELQSNYYLSKYYNITVHATTNIKFAAKQAGTRFQISFDLSACPAYINGGQTLGVDAVKNENYKVFVQLLVSGQNQDNFQEISASYLDPDSQQKVYYYPSRILQSEFNSSQLPGFNSAQIEPWIGGVRNYKIRYGEYFGSDPMVHRLHSHKVMTVIDGKLHNDKWPGHNFLSEIAQSKTFLSNKTISQDTWLDAQQYLYFMNYTESDYDFTAHIDITYDDGTTVVQAKSLPQVDSIYENIYCIPVGIQQLGLDELDPGKTISYYKIYLVHDAELISQVRYFYLINRPLNSLQLLYKNNYSGLESLLCQNAKVKLKHESVHISRLLTHDYDLTEGNRSSGIKQQWITLSVHTGYLAKDEAYQLSELFENNTVFLVGKSKFLKVELESSSLTLIDQKDDLQNFEFSFRLSTSGTTSFNQIL